MARQEQDREDLLREATALAERAEFQWDSCAEPVVIGFRRDGSASFFIGSEYVFQFNSAKQLRRGYFEGRLLKAEEGKLVSLARERRPGEVVLRRHDLSSEETVSMLTLIREHLDALAERFRRERPASVAQVPAEADVVGRIRSWLASLGRIEIARRPHVS